MGFVYFQLIFKAANVPVDFETFFFSEINPVLSSKLEDVTASIQKNKICLKVRHYHLQALNHNKTTRRN